MARRVDSFKLLGSKGATGTQASFMELFDGDHEKIRRMEDMIAAEMGFDGVAPVSGQTYSRKIDYLVLSALSGMAQSAGKFATDMRLLAHLKECEEPFESGQIGSSAMPYKRNPMRCERVCSLARLVIVNAQNGALTAYNQWFERTLDDSANRRVVIPETFLAADAILNICINVASGVRVYPEVIRRHIDEELPFMATENIMMKAVRRGGDRQRLHEAIRSHSALAGQRVKERGLPNDLIERLAADPLFGMTRDEITAELDPVKYTGRAGRQVDEFLDGEVSAALEDARARYGDDFGLSAAYGGDEPRV
jgi:adenylosuccinate lyase